ncbi:MAG: uracil-DNA glycosylase [Oligoflexia bacterium]
MWLQFPRAEGWSALLADESSKPYFKVLDRFLAQEEASGATVFPERGSIFRALEEVALGSSKVVILGQDPYHGHGQAVGRSFAVPNSFTPKPPSLTNIYREIESDFSCSVDRSQSDLSGWSAQGVLLLNTVLTVRAGAPLSHRKKGWEELTDRLIVELARHPQPRVFMLWGAEARAKASLIRSESDEHLILEAPHPSPLSAHRGFLGCRHFSQANAFLGKTHSGARAGIPIDWTRLSSVT